MISHSRKAKAAMFMSVIFFSALLTSTPSQAAGTDVSYVACYFNNNNNIVWKWALTPANDWYSFSGSWIKTTYTKLDKFLANSATKSELLDACDNAKRYYNVQGELFALFAAISDRGSNYPILLNSNEELYPRY